MKSRNIVFGFLAFKTKTKFSNIIEAVVVVVVVVLFFQNLRNRENEKQCKTLILVIFNSKMITSPVMNSSEIILIE